MAKSRSPYQPTKKHLARLERERLQQRYLMIGTVIVALAVVAVLLGGYLQQNVLQPRQTVAKVGNVEIKAAEFIQRTRFERSLLVNQAVGTYQTLSLLGDQNQDFTLSILNNLQQIAAELDAESFGQSVLNKMIDDVLIRREAESRGITVTDEEVENEIQLQFGFVAEDAPATPTAFPTALPTATLSATQLALVPPTATPTESPTATPDLTATATPTLAPTVTPTLGPTLTPTPYTLEAFQQNYQNTINDFETNAGVTEETLRDVIRASLYQQKLMADISKEQAATREKIWARHILVEDEETAKQVLEDLKNGGDFVTLASQFSTDPGSKDTGGDLSWFGLGDMVPEFEQVAFNLNIGQISDPVKTSFGWHIIQLLGREEQSLTEGEYTQAQQITFQEWLTNIRLDEEVEMFDVWKSMVPTEPAIPPEILNNLTGQQ